MRTLEQITKLIDLYRAEAKRLQAESMTSGNVSAWFSCKVAIADLYEELQVTRELENKRAA